VNMQEDSGHAVLPSRFKTCIFYQQILSLLNHYLKIQFYHKIFNIFVSPDTCQRGESLWWGGAPLRRERPIAASSQSGTPAKMRRFFRSFLLKDDKIFVCNFS